MNRFKRNSPISFLDNIFKGGRNIMDMSEASFSFAYQFEVLEIYVNL